MSTLRTSAGPTGIDPFGATQPLLDEQNNRRLGVNHELDQTRVIGSQRSAAKSVHRAAISENDNRKGGTENCGDSTGVLPSGTSTKTRTVADLRAARESRANEALKMKDEQLRILQVQNNQLLSNLDRVEEEATRIQQERLTAEEENRTLRETVFESQGRTRAAEAALKKVQAEAADRDKQLRIMTDQNAELLRLLEEEEAQTTRLNAAHEAAVKELEALRSKYGSLLTTAKTHEEMAGRAAREGQLRAEEVRLLRAESEQVKHQNSELKMKTQVELESLQEQLRVRKEKQYQLLEKLQGQEEAKRQAEDQVSGMEDKLRALHAKSLELETQLQVEARGRRFAEEANRELVTGAENARQNVRELQGKVERSESERMRMEMESRDSGEQLREMAEKVFQLLERLKLAELGKNKAMEALRHKDQELVAMKQKNSRLIKESTKEGKSRVKAELDLRVCQDQVSALKKHNAQLASRCREEAKAKLREHEERVETQDKVRTLGGRLSFLLNKMQSDEESRVILKEEAKKTEAQVKSLTARAEELQRKLEEAGESNRIITQAVRLKQDEVDQLTVINNAVNRQLKGKDPATAISEESRPEVESMGIDGEDGGGTGKARSNGGDGRDIDSVRSSGGRGVFYVESRPTQGLLLAQAKRAADREWLDGREVNVFLKRAQKKPRFKELAIERICQAYALLLVEEEDRKSKDVELEGRAEQLELMCRKNAYLQDKVAVEEEAKRRTLLRYIHAVKAAASLGVDDESHKSMTAAVGRPGRGIIQLPESGLTNEEVHAIAALLRGNTTIAELNLRGNEITDEGAAALGAVLAGRMGLRSVDLRGNHISKQGIRTIAEALDRSERVRHVYVHAGGKVEALGTGVWAAPRANTMGGGGDASPNNHRSQQQGAPALPLSTSNVSSTVPLVTVETVCVVDLRENTPLAGPDNSAVGAAALAAAMEDPSAPLPPGAASHLASGTGGGRAPVFATSVLPGELSSSVVSSGGGRTSGVGREEKAAERLKRQTAARRRAERRMREQEGSRNRQMELGWCGRSGGLDTRPTTRGSTGAEPRASAGGLPRVGASGRGGKLGHGQWRWDESDGEDVHTDHLVHAEAGSGLHRSISAPDFPGSAAADRRQRPRAARASPLAGGRSKRGRS